MTDIVGAEQPLVKLRLKLTAAEKEIERLRAALKRAAQQIEQGEYRADVIKEICEALSEPHPREGYSGPMGQSL